MASAHWEKKKLFVYLLGGRFTSFTGDEARAIWAEISEPARNLLIRGDDVPVGQVG